MRFWMIVFSLMLLPSLSLLGCEDTDDDDDTAADDDDTGDDDDTADDDDDDTGDDDDSADDDDDSADDDDDTEEDDDDVSDDDDSTDDDDSEPTEPDIDVNPANLQLGTLCVGMAMATQIDISNVGTADLTVTNVATLSPDIGVAFTTPQTIPPGVTQYATVDVTCNAEIQIQAQITIESDDPDENPFIVTVTGDCDEC